MERQMDPVLPQVVRRMAARTGRLMDLVQTQVARRTDIRWLRYDLRWHDGRHIRWLRYDLRWHDGWNVRWIWYDLGWHDGWNVRWNRHDPGGTTDGASDGSGTPQMVRRMERCSQMDRYDLRWHDGRHIRWIRYYLRWHDGWNVRWIWYDLGWHDGWNVRWNRHDHRWHDGWTSDGSGTTSGGTGNTPPTGLSLDNSSVAENSAGAVIEASRLQMLTLMKASAINYPVRTPLALGWLMQVWL